MLSIEKNKSNSKLISTNRNTYFYSKKNLTCKQEEHGFHSKKYWGMHKWKMSFLSGYSGFNLNRNWLLSKVKINSTKRRSRGEGVFTQVKTNYLKKMRFTDKTTYAQIMVLTRRKTASVLGRSTFLLENSSIKKKLWLIGKVGSTLINNNFR